MSKELEAAADASASRLLKLEKQASRHSASYRRMLALGLTRLDALWKDDMTASETAAARYNLERYIVSMLAGADATGRVVRRQVQAASTAGVRAASTQIRLGSGPSVPASAAWNRLSVEVEDAVSAIPGAISEQSARARVLLSAATTKAEAKAALLVAGQAATRIENAATWTTNRAHADAMNRVVVDHGHRLIWRAERNACVRCLGLSGQIDSGAGYPGGVSRPPLHPRCRCEQVVWNPAWRQPGEVGLPEAYQREAQRSILRGTKLPSESDDVRVAAARALLERGTNLPQSVQRVARTAVKRGSFKPV